MNVLITTMTRLFSKAFLSVLIYSISFSIFAYNATEDYWQCYDQLSGRGGFGSFSIGCNVTPFGAESFVTANYSSVIFDDNTADLSTERNRYMQELYAFIRDAADYYLLSRKPDANIDERRAWQHAIYSVAHQESYWTHYRDATDGKMKMIRGDSGHGHGMMQIDDRWHFTELNNGKGFNLIENILYAMDIYYAEWQRAPQQSCLDSATNWRDRARSAYSAYNGGYSQICRWTNPEDRWAQNDINFAAKYDNSDWDNYIGNLSHISPLDIKCLAENDANCHQSDFISWNGGLLKIDSGHRCISSDQQLHCITDDGNAICLGYFADFNPQQITELTTGDVAGISRTEYNHHQICDEFITDLHTVGSFIHILQDTELLAAPGSGKIGDIPAHMILQVLDFEIEDHLDHDRHYMVTYEGETGYINAGDKNDQNTWTQITTEIPVEQLIPVTGQTIRIVPQDGINLRETPGGNWISAVPNGIELVVQSYVVKDTDNKLYYEVDYQGQSGFIYGGHIFEPPTVASWVELVATSEDSGQNNSNNGSDSGNSESSSGSGGSTKITLILLLLAICLCKKYYLKLAC